MKNRHLTELLVVVGATVLLPCRIPAAWGAQPPPMDHEAHQAVPTSDLMVVGQNGVTTSGPNAARYDFGKVDPIVRPQLEHTFTLRNQSAKPVVISRLQASCGCTGVFLGDQNVRSGNAERTVAPGEQLDVRLSVDVTRLRGGKLHKPVWVYLQDGAMPAVTLEMAADLLEVVSVSPPQLNFGRVVAGAKPAQTVTVTLDPRLANGAPALTSSSPDVLVAPTDTKAPTTTASDGKPQSVVRTYTVTLSPRAGLGTLSALLSFAPRPTNTPPAALAVPSPSTATLPALLAGVQVPVAAQVEGSVSAVPTTLVFGTITKGQAATRQITLVGVSPDALKKLSVASGSPWLSARLRASEPAPSEPPVSPTMLLEVTLATTAPPGGVQAQVTVTTAQGERLVVPVMAYVIDQPVASNPTER